MKKLLFALSVLATLVMVSCSSGDDGPSAPPKIDVTKLYGEWKQMPEQYSDGRYDDEDYYHTINVNDNLTFTGLWCEGYDKDEDRLYYSNVSGRITIENNSLKLYQNFYDEDGEFDETEESGPYEIVTLTDDILVLREVYKDNGHVTGYYYIGFYRAHAADMLPTLGYVSNLSDAEIKIYKSNGVALSSSPDLLYNSSACQERFTIKVYATTLDGITFESKDAYINVYSFYDTFFSFAHEGDELTLNIAENTSLLLRSGDLTVYTSVGPRDDFWPEVTIEIAQSGVPVPDSGSSSGGSSGGGSSSGGDSGVTPESEWVQVSDSPGKMPYWYCPTDGETIPAHPSSKNYTTYKNTRTGAYKIKYGYDEYTVKKGYNKISIDTEYHSVYDSKYGFWKSCLDRYYIECTVY